MKRKLKTQKSSHVTKKTCSKSITPSEFLVILNDFFPTVLSDLIAQYNPRVPLPSNIHFAEEKDIDSPNIVPGIIGVESFGRGGWSYPFIVIRNQTPNNKVLDVITPRFHFGPELTFGIDKQYEKDFVELVECTCYKGTGFSGCGCGAFETNKKHYHETFRCVPPTYLYEVETLSEDCHVGFEFPSDFRIRESLCW